MFLLLSVPGIDVFDFQYDLWREKFLFRILICPPCQHGFRYRAIVTENVVLEGILQLLCMEQEITKGHRFAFNDI